MTMHHAADTTQTSRPTAVMKAAGRRAAGQQTPPPCGKKITANEARPQPDYIADAIDIFVTKLDGAIGKAAFRYDHEGFYDIATSTPEYYLREGDVGLHERHSRACANRINGIETAVIVGQGPGHIFKSKEGETLPQLLRLKRVITIDIADDNNRDAGHFVKGELSDLFGRAIEHIAITADFRKAMVLRPDLFPPEERRAVFCSGGTIMNLPPTVLGTFPARALQNDLEIFADLAGHNGHALFSYDSNQDRVSLLAPYTTDAAKNLFLNVIDVLAKECPELKGLTREHFEYVVDYNPDTHEVRQGLVVIKPCKFVLPFKGDRNITGQHAVNLHIGDEFHMISSYKPEVASVETVANATGRLSTALVTREDQGPTLHLFKARRRPTVA